MSKRKYTRWLKGFIKTCIILVIVQMLIVLLFTYFFLDNRPISPQDLKSEAAIVDETVFRYLPYSGNSFYFLSDSYKYAFPSLTFRGVKTSIRDLNRSIQEGDLLIVEYVEEDDGERLVVGVQKDGKVLRSIEEYNRCITENRRSGIISMVIIETIFVMISAIIITWWILFEKPSNKRSGKRFKRRRHIQETGSGSQ